MSIIVHTPEICLLEATNRRMEKVKPLEVRRHPMQWDKTGSKHATMLHENPMPLVELEVRAYLMTKAAWQHAPCGGCLFQLGMTQGVEMPHLCLASREKKEKDAKAWRDKTNHRSSCPIACQLLANDGPQQIPIPERLQVSTRIINARDAPATPSNLQRPILFLYKVTLRPTRENNWA